jgi:Protein of unknown function (DUF1570)
MRRFLPAAVMALLVVVVASPVNAGYLIIRVILEGASGSAGGYSESGMGMTGGLMPPGSGSLPSYGGGKTPGYGGATPVGPPGGPGDMSTPAAAHKHDPTRSLVVVVPIEEDLSKATAFYPKLAANHFTNPAWRLKLHVNHRGEKYVTNVFTDDVTVQLYDTLLRTPAPRRTRPFEVRDLHIKWTRMKNDPKILFQALTSALEAGMIEEAVSYADELLAYSTEKPAGLPPEVTAFAQAYKAMQQGIKSPASKQNTAHQWQARLRAQNVATKSHYSLISWDATQSEVDRRAAMLEENFRGFFLWHATRGIVLPVPDAPLMVVLPKTGRELIRLARALDAPGRLPADGFYSVEHDLFFLSPERLDEIGQTFTRQSQQIYQAGAGRQTLLHGDGPKLHINAIEGRKKPEDVARMQTLALVDRLVEDEATVSTISREGTRQLLYATGLLPRFVELPEWLSNGAVNFFTRPKDPAFVTDSEGKAHVAVAMETGYGLPNYMLQRYFRDFIEKKELQPDRALLLKNVLTDAYFRGLRDAKDATDPDPIKPKAKAVSAAGGGGATTGTQSGGIGRPPMSLPMFSGAPPIGSSGFGPTRGLGGMPPGAMGLGMGQQPGSDEDDPATILRKKRDRLGLKSEATAWALFYYLAKDHPDQLRRFVDELGTLPRDLPLDGDTVVAVFCRAFAIENNKVSLTRFANEWLDYISSIPPAWIDVELVEPKPSSASSPNGPGGYGAPGSGSNYPTGGPSP